MHIKILPNYFLFVDRYNKEDYDNHSTNLAIIYRNYSRPINENSLIEFKKFCKKNKFNFYLANQIKLAIKFNLNGYRMITPSNRTEGV